MRPEWHRCETCYFMAHGADGLPYCHFDPEPLETVEGSFCSRWQCHACMGSWDENGHGDCIVVDAELED